MKTQLLALGGLLLSSLVLLADDDATRGAFATSPGRSVAAALKKATTEQKRVLVIVTEPKRNHAPHIKATMNSEVTRNLIKDNFIVVVTDFKDKAVIEHVKGVSDVHPAFVLFKPDGTVIQSGDAAMGPAGWQNQVQEWVANP